MSCSCGSNCSCSNCKCGKRSMDLDEKITTTETMIIGFGPAKSEFEGFEMATEGQNVCKCGSNCSCTNCNC
ncbi:Metallothionein-like protein 1 [Carex littledalei]|uniref:Metallothionein-like protein n=1 Tax=Carex littledalei TaxID=544730 RepID=A0A833R098_9POAL|nr:Metallothionein-like protein 1 [Carex littledalei]